MMKCIALLLTGALAAILALVSYAAGSLGTATTALVAAVMLIAAGLFTANRQPLADVEEPLPAIVPAVT